MKHNSCELKNIIFLTTSLSPSCNDDDDDEDGGNDDGNDYEDRTTIILF